MTEEQILEIAAKVRHPCAGGEAVKIPEIALFAYQTKGEALEVANHQEDVEVATVYIKKGFSLAEVPVCYLVLPKEKQ